MELSIEYCGQWGYKPQALRVRLELIDLIRGVNVKLIEGKGGIFEITCDSRVLFSKTIMNRFPTNEDLHELKNDIDLI